MSFNSSQIFESYVPVYDVMPEKWEEGRPILVEQLKKTSNAVNIRQIGWYLDEEVISGKQFFPGVVDNQIFRTIFRKVIDFSPLVIGLNTMPHGVVVDARFRLINLYGAGSDATAFTGHPFNQPNITYDATNIYITSDAAFDFGQAVFEYIQEL